jgi:type II secretory pathway component PulK
MDVEVTATPSSVAATGTPSQRQTNNTNSISLVSDSEKDKSSEDEDNTARFRRRIATSRIEDAEASRSEAILPEEIAGTARDQDIADAARQAKSSASVRTQPGKRTAKGVVDEISQPRKRVQRKPSPDEVSEDEDEDDEESSTRFRRRKK